MKQLLTLSLIGILIGFTSVSEARRDQKRERRQQGRIAEGIQSGELTKGEAKKLIRGQRRLDRAQERATADGVVTPGEKARLELRQDHLSKEIYQQKHDDDKRE